VNTGQNDQSVIEDHSATAGRFCAGSNKSQSSATFSISAVILIADWMKKGCLR
jgi:hypothetical protein